MELNINRHTSAWVRTEVLRAAGVVSPRNRDRRMSRFTPNGSLLILARCRRTINRWVAAYIALLERRATALVLRTLNQRQLNDIGVSDSKSAARSIERLKRQIVTM